MGTTVTALLRTGGRLALAHIGDSRAYLLRDGELIQITQDHTFVQTLVDEGRLTPEEAEQHPQRSVLMRVLSDVVDDVEPDLSMREARLGDRYLLCSDGLSGVVSYDTLQRHPRPRRRPGRRPARPWSSSPCARGAPTTSPASSPTSSTPRRAAGTSPAVVGAASLQPARPRRPSAAPSAAERAAALTAPVPMSAASGDTQPIPLAATRDEAQLLAEPQQAPRRGLRLAGVLVVLAVLVAGGSPPGSG